MSAFSEKFQAELGTRLAQAVSGFLSLVLTIAAFGVGYKQTMARWILLSMSAMSLLALSVSLFFRYFQIVRRQRTVDEILRVLEKRHTK